MLNPLVSIGIPAYNRPDGLRRALESILAQSYSNFEVLIVDDCSDDERVRSVSQEFAAKDVRVRYICNAHNKGVLRNAAEIPGQMRGEFFCWVSDDDWRHKDFIKNLLELLIENPKFGAACSEFLEVDINNQPDSNYKMTHFNKLTTALLGSSSQFIRMISFYSMSGRNGKGNLFYGLFRMDLLRSLDIERISNHYAYFNMDCLIIYSYLINSRIIFTAHKLFSLTCGNTKHYQDEPQRRHGIYQFLSSMNSYYLELSSDKISYVRITKSSLLRISITTIYPLKVSIFYLSVIQRIIKTRLSLWIMG